jgi:hypothetical protein
VNLYDSTLANSFSTVVVTLKQGSTISGGVVTFEVSDTTAFTNAYNALCWQMTGAVTTSTYTLTATTNVSFQCNVASFAAFRIRLSTVITGSATVNVGVQPSAAPSQPYTIVTPANGSTTTVSGTVTANAGSNLNTSLLALESGGNLATLAGGVAASVYQANVKQVNGVTTLAGAGATGTGSQRETVAQDTTTIAGSAPGTAGSASTNVVTVQGIASMTKLLVTPDSVALPSNQSVNVSQINGITPLMGNGVTGTGSQRVTIASDNTAFSVNATLSAETTKAIGVVRNADGAGNLLLSAANALNSTGTGVLATQAVGQFDDVAPTAITENQFGNLRMSANRNLYNTIRDAAGNERGANVNSSNQLSVSCDNGCAGGTFNNNADAVATSATNGQSAAWLYGFNGTTYDRLRVDGSKNLEVNCATCGTTDNTAYTLGTGSINVTGGVSQSGTPTAVSAGQAVSFVTDLNRRLEITCPDGTCSAAGGSLQIKDGANTSTNVGYYPGNLNMPVQEVNSTNILSAVNKLTSTFAPRSVYGVNPGLVPVQAVNAFVTNLPGIDLSTVSKVPLTGQVAGSLPVTIVAGAGSGGTASNFAAAFPAAGTAIGVKSGANMVNLTADGSNNLNVNCTVGCSGGATTPADAFANPTTAGVQFDFLAGYNGTTWDRLRVDGSKNLLVGVNAALPAGSNVIGHVITDTGSTTAVTGTVTTTDNITQFGGVNLSTGTGASGTGIPRVTVANDSNILATESGTWSIRNQDGAGNALTSNSTTYTAKFGLDANLLGTLGTAFSTAGKIDVKGADGDVFVRSNAASTFPVNIGTWIGSAAPTVGSKTSANSIPVVVASDQGSIPVTLTSTTVTGTVAVTQSTSPWVDAGNKTNNNAAPGATNIGTLPGVATAVAPTYVEGNQVSLSTDLTGALRVSGSAGGGVAQTQVRDALNNWTDVGYKSGNLNMPVQEANSSALVASINALISTVKTDRLLGTLGQPISSTGSALDVAVKYTNPCNDPSQLRSAPISQTANTRLIVAEAKIMICGVFVIGADAENVSIVSGTGATCGTGTAAVIGGSTAANGPNMAANGGWTMSFSVPAPAVDLCLFQSGSGRVAGVLTYAFMR